MITITRYLFFALCPQESFCIDIIVIVSSAPFPDEDLIPIFFYLIPIMYGADNDGYYCHC